MAKHRPLTTDTPWFRLDVTAADWKKEDPVLLARLLEQLFVIRRFEEKILDLFKRGLVHGPAHSSIGQEGGAIGAMSVLTAGDKINATHRAHHQFLAKFLNYATPDGYDPRQDSFPNHNAGDGLPLDGGDHGTRAGILPRPRRLDAHAPR